MNRVQDTASLNNGVKMPWFGLGVFKAEEGQEVQNAVKWALEAGYRSIDTAAFYQNESGVGQAIRDSEVARQDVFVTTKLWNSDQGYDSAFQAFETSMRKLNLDYVDLYLIHWPVKGKYKESWRALEEIYQSGRAKAIGVSNFLRFQLEDLLESANVVPTVNQIEYHPYLQQPELHEFCRTHQIQLEAWSPIMRGKVMAVPELIQLAETYGKTPVQITLRWMLQREVVTIPKSANRQRIQENADIYDFELTAADIELINGLDRQERLGPDPANFDF